MNADRYQRAESLFTRAMAMPAAARRAFLLHEAGGDHQLASSVERMIQFAEHPDSTTPILAPLIHDNASSRAGGSGGDANALSLVGVTLGRYDIEALLGEGGFGAVYRATQQHPVKRSVAIKILKGGMDSRSVLARFEAERQALAVMEHASIARVFDAGQTDAVHGSRPYFVMELVTGVPITQYCDEHRLDWRARLNLFCQIAGAVHHAHQRGVIHRDLKPSNIIVAEIDGVPVPKVIDFGIAKAVHQPLGSPSVTNRMEILGTPQYMSPEQADNNERAIDIRTDVYSLGVVLYELLTGSTPLDVQLLRSASYSQMLRLIVDQRPERPSARITRIGSTAGEVASKRSTDAPHLRRRLKGELDWITMKALEPDRERRYGSAHALAEDVHRYLNHEPVSAGPPSAAYRMRKFVRRNRTTVAAAAMVAMAVVTGSVMATAGLLRANRSADQARQINDFMSEVLMSPNPEIDGADVKLADVLHKASRTAATRFAGHPDTEAQVRTMLGDVFHSLNLLQPAGEEYARSIDLWMQVAGPDDSRTLQSQLQYGSLLGNQNAGRQLFDLAVEVTPRIHRVFGPESEQAMEAQCLRGLALIRLTKFDEARQTFEDGLKRMKTLHVSGRCQVRMLDGLATLLNQRLGLLAEGPNVEMVNQLLDVSTKLRTLTLEHFGQRSVHHIRAESFLATAANLKGDHETAVAACRAALESMPPNRFGDCHRERIQLWNVLASSLNRLGEFEEAADIRLAQIDCLRRADESQQLWLLSIMHDSIPYLERGGRWEQGESLMGEFMALLAKFGSAHGPLDFRAKCYIAYFASLQGRLDQADQLFAELTILHGDTQDDALATANYHLTYGSHLTRRGEFEEAERHLQVVVGLMDDLRNGFWPTHPDDVILQFIALYKAWDKPDMVAEYEQLRLEALNPLDEHGNPAIRW